MRNVDKETIIRFVQFYDYRYLWSELEKITERDSHRLLGSFLAAVSMSPANNTLCFVYILCMHAFMQSYKFKIPLYLTAEESIYDEEQLLKKELEEKAMFHPIIKRSSFNT